MAQIMNMRGCFVYLIIGLVLVIGFDGIEARTATTKEVNNALEDRPNRKDPLDVSFPLQQTNDPSIVITQLPKVPQITTLASTVKPSSTTIGAPSNNVEVVRPTSPSSDHLLLGVIPINKTQLIEELEQHDDTEIADITVKEHAPTTPKRIISTSSTTTTTTSALTTTSKPTLITLKSTSELTTIEPTKHLHTTKKPAFIEPDTLDEPQVDNKPIILDEEETNNTPVKLPGVGISSTGDLSANPNSINGIENQETTAALNVVSEQDTELDNQLPQHAPHNETMGLGSNRHPCDTAGCQNAGMCINVGTSNFICRCSHLFRGKTCEISVLKSLVYTEDSCIEYCLHGKCKTHEDDEYRCYCNPGWIGPSCQLLESVFKKSFYNWINSTDELLWEKVKESTSQSICQDHQCTHFGVCIATSPSTYQCQCPPSYYGHFCEHHIEDLCANNPCKNGATCEVAGNNQLACSCSEDYYGPFCEHTDNSCYSNPCLHGASCTSVPNNGFTCTCLEGFVGERCEEEFTDMCRDSPCNNGATCTNNGPDGFLCTCAPGYSGESCDILYIDPCKAQPCLHGICEVNHKNRTDYLCLCNEQFEGRNCETPILPCDVSPCGDHGNCTNLVEGYKCTCEDGFVGRQCTIHVTCIQRPCYNGGSCVASHDTRICQCASGYGGERCERIINACALSDCQNGASCINMDGGKTYGCLCPRGYVGLKCESPDPCIPNPCLNDGNCTMSTTGKGHRCTCDKYYHGELCERPRHPWPKYERIKPIILGHGRHRRSLLAAIPRDEPCGTERCQNNGVCVRRGHVHMCICTGGYYGDTCSQETRADKCTGRMCQHGGICQNTVGDKAMCVCPIAYSGTRCQLFRDPCARKPCHVHHTCLVMHKDLIHGYMCLADKIHGKPTHLELFSINGTAPTGTPEEQNVSAGFLITCSVLLVALWTCILSCLRTSWRVDRRGMMDLGRTDTNNLQKWKGRIWQRLQNRPKEEDCQLLTDRQLMEVMS